MAGPLLLQLPLATWEPFAVPELWLALTVEIAALAVLVSIRRQLKRRRRLLGEVEAQLVALGLERLEGEREGAVTLGGLWCDTPVLARLSVGTSLLELVAVELGVRGAFPGLSARLVDEGPPRRPDEPPTGDPAFDGPVAVRTESFVALVQLGSPVRAALQRVLKLGWTLVDGELHRRFTLRAAGPLTAARWRAAVSELLVARSAAPTSLGERLAGEPSGEVRFQLLAALADFGEDFVRRALPASAASDASAPVSALAALLLGDGAAWEFAPGWAQRQVEKRAPTQLVALHRARRDEAALIALLSRDALELVLPAVDALCAIGGRDSVAPLQALVEPGPLGGRRSEAARRAILQVQARLAGAERGQIELVEAPGEAGRVEVIGEGGEIGVAEGGQITIK